MRALLDVNVLIALFDADHSLHASALRWFDEHSKAGWASCPITQNGCVRIMSQPRYANPLPVHAIVERLREATAHARHEFWPDGLSVLDPDLVDSSRIHGPRQLTDAYLLALAVAREGRLVTFDRSLAIEAVPRAERKHIVVI